MTTTKGQRLATCVFWTSAFLACFSFAALVAIAITIAKQLAPPDELIYYFVLAASLANIVALVASIITAILYQIGFARKLIRVLGATSATLTAAAAGLTLYTLLLTKTRLESQRYTAIYQSAVALVYVGYGIWAVALLSELVLHALIFRSKEKPPAATLMTQVSNGTTTPARLAKRSPSIISPPTPLFTPPMPTTRAWGTTEPMSSAFSAYSENIRPSFRDSIVRVIKPVTSKTRLIFHHRYFSQESNGLASTRESSVDLTRENDGFENWEVSPPPMPFVADNRFLRRYAEQGLEPIPGSRPQSMQPSSPPHIPQLDLLRDSPPLPRSFSLQTTTPSRAYPQEVNAFTPSSPFTSPASEESTLLRKEKRVYAHSRNTSSVAAHPFPIRPQHSRAPSGSVVDYQQQPLPNMHPVFRSQQPLLASSPSTAAPLHAIRTPERTQQGGHRRVASAAPQSPHSDLMDFSPSPEMQSVAGGVPGRAWNSVRRSPGAYRGWS